MDIENTKERQPIGSSEQAPSEQTSPKQVSPEQVSPEQVSPGQVSPEQASPEQGTHEGAEAAVTETDEAEKKPDIKQDDAERKSEEKSSEESKAFISDFAPEPIVIPNYNAEKEHKKRRKEKARDQKKLSQRRKKTRRVVRKILFAARCILMFALLFAVMTATLTSLLVRVNTSEYAVENSIKNNNPETFVIGKIDDPTALNIKKSSSRAAITDILRDNARGTITYADIKQAVSKSSYDEFIAKQAHGVIAYLLYGEAYGGVRGKDVAKVMRDNISYIKLVTEIELGESACDEFGAYVDKSSALDEIKPAALSKTKAAQYTQTTTVAFSLMVLVCLAVAMMLLILVTAAACSGKAHTVIGWSGMLSGLAVGIGGFMFKPSFAAKSLFVRDVFNALLRSFHRTAVFYGAVMFGISLLILLIGHAMSDSDEDIEEN